MGVYDYVAKGDTILQIKCAENYLKCYQLGENINIHVPPKPFTIFKIEQYNANIWRIYYN